MDMEILVSAVLKAHGFPTTPNVLTVSVARLVKIDFHPPNMLLYAELDIQRGFAFNANLHINPRIRHRGIGARLQAAYEEICREARVTILINNNRNPAFWRKLGFRRLNPFRQMLLSRHLNIAFDKGSMYKVV
ncbi:MAG: GNAT family N-acetyltransferase [Gammaproteobacteria bacterium]|nr:GNAT family N-acetyltransferase [Gammaproteobacteria bacterium]MCP5298453.1 GNAT family N-acetyltransferase [Chromatiaceae bacterium]